MSCAVFTIFWKEFRGFVTSPLAYIFLILFLLWLGVNYFFGNIAAGGSFTGIQVKEASLESLFQALPSAFVIIVPALAMRLWPDEIKLGTLELLMTYPVRSWEVVLGKFLAGLALIGVALALTLVTPLTVDSYARTANGLDWGPVWGSYAASLLLGGAFLAVGLFAGALCREQVTAFIVALFTCGMLVLLGTSAFLIQSADWFADIARQVSFTVRFESMARGVLDVRDLVYFASFTALFLFLNVVTLEARKAS
jgi:ABC-2 type transport system permease protein